MGHNHKKISGIYSIANIDDKHQYIGSSCDVKNRWYNHRWGLKNKRHHSPYLQRAWEKYGPEKFVFSILEECTKDTLVSREQHYIDLYKPEYNTAPFAATPPPPDPERSRRVMKAQWKNGIFDKSMKPVERIDPNTGEVKEYKSMSEAERDGFEQSCVSACVLGKLSSYANYYWKCLDGLIPESAFEYEKIFRPVIGTQKIQIVILSSYDECHKAGFNYAKIKACCLGLRGRRTHNGYSWAYIEKSTQSTVEKLRSKTHKEVFAKAVLGTNVGTNETRFYSSQAETERDGFSQRHVSACCLGKRQTHKGYTWKFA